MGYARGQKKPSRYSQLARFCCLGMAPTPVQAPDRSDREQDPLRPSAGLRCSESDDYISLFVPFIDIPVRLDNLLQRIASIYDCS